MKTLWFVPLTYVAGVDGFALFAPYLFLFVTAVYVLRRRPRREAAVAVARTSDASSSHASASLPDPSLFAAAVSPAM